jgi:hypothetical protein
MLAQNFNRRTNVAMEHNYSLGDTQNVTHIKNLLSNSLVFV